jgi:capsular polysaccharide export protein
MTAFGQRRSIRPGLSLPGASADRSVPIRGDRPDGSLFGGSIQASRPVMVNSAFSERGFLFLQGLASWFFDRLGRALLARGHRVHRVNFNGGDHAFWRLPGAVDFCEREHEWPEFLGRLIVERSLSDIILFGDCRPLHRAAIRVAQSRGLRVCVVEEGYLRPDWITFEEGGVNGFSSLPRDPAWYREQARLLPPWRDHPEFGGSFRRRAIEDITYNIASKMGARRFPHYATHRPYHQVIEYAGWIRRLALKRGADKEAAVAIQDLQKVPDPLFLFPLQLDCDYQMRVHSPFRGMHLAIEHVLNSFARHAADRARLVVKQHPLDNGVIDWRAITGHIAAELGLADRLVVIDGGNLDKLLARCRAVVTVNSTVGCQALARGVPVMALGEAIYDIAGLTHRGDPDEFWNAPEPPDPELFDAFRRVLVARSLIPGSFFSEAGLKSAVEAAVDRLEAVHARPARGFVSQSAGVIANSPQPITAMSAR